MSETNVPALEELEAAMSTLRYAAFRAELDELLANYVVRPTPVTRFATRLARAIDPEGERIAWLGLKREDL